MDQIISDHLQDYNSVFSLLTNTLSITKKVITDDDVRLQFGKFYYTYTKFEKTVIEKIFTNTNHLLIEIHLWGASKVLTLKTHSRDVISWKNGKLVSKGDDEVTYHYDNEENLIAIEHSDYVVILDIISERGDEVYDNVDTIFLFTNIDINLYRLHDKNYRDQLENVNLKFYYDDDKLNMLYITNENRDYDEILEEIE